MLAAEVALRHGSQRMLETDDDEIAYFTVR